MRVATYYSNSDVRIEDVRRPEPSSGEILLEMRSCGICGSDVMEWYRSKRAPLVLGHEACGEIVKLGEGVDGYSLGERVFASHHVPCNTCHYCLSGHHTACETLHTTNFIPGGFSEYILLPRINVERGVWPLPRHSSWEEGALIEPLACVVRSLRTANFTPGQSVLVLGSGVSGLLHVMLAKSFGAAEIYASDISAYRLEAAKNFGAKCVFDAREDVAAELRSVHRRGVDLVVVCTGAPEAFEMASSCVDRGGTLLCFATTEPGVELSVPINYFWRNAIALLPSYGASPLDIATAIDLISQGRVPVKDLVTHRFELEDTALGFCLVAEGGAGDECLKVIVTNG